MKKYLFALLLGAMAFLVACDDDDNTPAVEWFATPTVTAVGTTASVSCETAIEIQEALETGFSYAAVTPIGTGEFMQTTAVTVDGKKMSASLTDLEAQTTYRVYAYVVLGDGMRYESDRVEFTTGKADDPGVPEVPQFDIAVASDMTVSSATVACTLTYDGKESISKAYFIYWTGNEEKKTADVSVESGAKQAELTDLSAATTYQFQLCVMIGANLYSSKTAEFTTLQQVTPGPSDTKYAGWPELPVEVDNSDYYYSYHICPDFSVGDHLARNYTVCFSAENHCPVWVAAPRHACYEVKSFDRTDSYGLDPTIDASIQYHSKKTGGGCNKGHMLGNSDRRVTRAVNHQVFYYTNIAPQYSSSFNNSAGAWNNLENFVDNQQLCSDTTYVVIGAYFKDFKDTYGQTCSPEKISFGGRSDVTRPSMFYYLILRTKSGSSGKSVFDCPTSELKCAAFVLRHNIEKTHKLSRTDMWSVTDLEKLVGFKFFTNVPQAPKDNFNPADWGL